MKILCIGDVVGEGGLSYLCEVLPGLKREYEADFVVANGENSDKTGIGLSRAAAETLLQYVDVITTGNHCYHRADETLYTEYETVLHPANYPFTENNTGCCLIDTGRRGTLRIINMMGLAWLESIDSPFKRADELLAAADAKYTVIDFHAESTAEKKAFAFYLDGRVGAVFGTHTHVQTADEQILPGGTGFVSDVGMTGPLVSVLGIEPQLAVQRQRSHVPVRFKPAGGAMMLNGALFTLDDETGLCVDVQRVNRRQGPP